MLTSFFIFYKIINTKMLIFIDLDKACYSLFLKVKVCVLIGIEQDTLYVVVLLCLQYPNALVRYGNDYNS